MAFLQDSNYGTAYDGYPSFPTELFHMVGSQYKIAQSFTPASSFSLYSVNVTEISRVMVWSYYNFEVYLNIYAADVNHKPTGSSLGQATLSNSLITEQLNLGLWSYFFFNPTVQLETGTEYVMVLSTNFVNTVTTNYLTVGYLNPSSYSGYCFTSTDGGSNWTAFTTDGQPNDLIFEMYSTHQLFESFDDGESDQVTAGGDYWSGQTFQASDDYRIKSVRLKLAKEAGQDVGSVVIHLRAVVDGLPSGEDIITGFIQDYQIPDTTPDWRDISFSLSTKLNSGTDYCFLISAPNANDNKLYIGCDVAGNGYANGTKLSSSDGGSSWDAIGSETDDLLFHIYGIYTGASGEPTLPSSDAVTTKKLWSIGSNEFWYENRDGDMVQLADSEGELDTTRPLSAVEAYGKVYVANESNLKVADFVNIKITTTNIGNHPPDFATLLTGQTSGAQMVVDYIDAVAGATTIYGRRKNSYPFQAELVTGLDDDGNSISFTSTAEVLPPHWYDWTVFGNSVNFGVMPDSATLVSLYNGRLVLAGSKQYPHEWWMSKSFEPHNFLYNQGDVLTAVSAGTTEAGKIGDIITALIPYGDDFFVFGCQSSMYLLDGDPTIGGTIESMNDFEGVYGAKSWTKDSANNLWFFSGDALYKARGGRSKPEVMSQLQLPSWSTDWELDPDQFRINLAYDPDENAITISHTSLMNGANRNFIYSLKTGGFYPATLPPSCGIFSSFYYNSNTTGTRCLVLGCSDGYLRRFSRTTPNDVITDDTEVAIDSFFGLPIIKLSDKDAEGKIQIIRFELGGGAAGYFVDTDSLDYEIYVGDDAETVLENMKFLGNEFSSGTLSSPGKSARIRPRARGFYGSMLLSNNTVDENFALNKIDFTVIKAGD